MKKFFLVNLCMCLVAMCSAQINYHKSPAGIVISANSVLLPTTAVTPTSVTSNNPLSTPQPYNTAFSDRINHIFQYVNRSYVTSGFLKDYGFEFTDIERFNGTLSSSNYAPISEWKAVYNTLYTYRFSPTNTMMHPGEVKDVISNFANQANGGSSPAGRMAYAATNAATNELVALHYKYEQFKADALSSTLVYVANGDQIFDTPNRPTTPYEVKEVFVFALPSGTLIGRDHIFTLQQQLFFGNTGKTISSMQINFGDGNGYQTLTFNTPKSVTYTTNGLKTVIFKVTYTDNSVYESHSQTEVIGIPVGGGPGVRYGIEEPDEIHTFPKAGFTTLPYQGVTGGAIVTVQYGRNNNTIRKPFIFVEGFDPWRIVNPDHPEKGRTFEWLTTVSDFATVNLNPGPLPSTLSDILEEGDYDLIYIDFEEATDYIQRNAYVVESVISWVNSVKQNYYGVRQQNVVIGVSLGGITGRYALKDMENRSINHEARVFISVDAPHRGVNVPLSLQAAVNHLANIPVGVGLAGFYWYPKSFTVGGFVDGLGNVARLLQEPAVKQIAIYRAVDNPFSSVLEHASGTEHATFMQEYHTLGRPNNCRMVYVANGSECGENQGFAPGSILADVDQPVPKGALGFLGTLGGIVAGAITNYPQLLTLAIPSGPNTINADITLRALPSQQVQEIYRGRLYIDRKILWLIDADTELSEKWMNSTASQLPLDTSPGGVFDIDILAPQAAGMNLPLSQRRFNFVPTPSALCIGESAAPLTLAELNALYSPLTPPVSPNQVPGNSFVTGFRTSPTKTNEPHVGLNPRNGQWILAEISGSPQLASCSSYCTSLTATVNGPTTVCNGNSTFTISSIPSGTTVFWGNDNPSLLSIQPNPPANSYVVTRGGGNAGMVTITGTITGLCGNFPFSKAVRVGGFSSTDYPVTGSSVACTNTTVYYNTVDLVGATSYSWFWPQDWTYNSGQGSRYLTVVTGSSPSTGAVGVRVANDCDAGGSPGTQFVQVNSCGGRIGIAIYPNPATDKLEIEFEEQDDKGNRKRPLPETQEYEVTLFDTSNREVVRLSTNDPTVDIPVSHLAAGMYILNVRHKSGLIQRHISIGEK